MIKNSGDRRAASFFCQFYWLFTESERGYTPAVIRTHLPKSWKNYIILLGAHNDINPAKYLSIWDNSNELCIARPKISGIIVIIIFLDIVNVGMVWGMTDSDMCYRHMSFTFLFLYANVFHNVINITIHSNRYILCTSTYIHEIDIIHIFNP